MGDRVAQVSKHLKVLAEADLVSVRTDGRYRHYRLDGRGLQAAHDWFASFDDVWHARFDALDDLVSNPQTPDQQSPHQPRPDQPSPHETQEYTR